MRPLIKKPVMIATLIIISMAGFIIMLMLTSKRGVGLSYDSALYIYMASFFNNPGSFGNNYFDHFVWRIFPPLFPLSLAAIHWLGGADPVVGARWLNACLFGMNIFMVGLLIYRYTEAIWLTVVGSLWMLVKIDILNFHSIAMAEPLFIFWTLLWAVFLMDFLETRSQGSFWACFLAAALACLTRLAGITLVLTGVVMLIFDKKKVIAKTPAVAIFLSAGIILLVLLMMRIYPGSHFIFWRFAFHPHSLTNLHLWSWPGNPSHDGGILLSLMAVMIYLGWRIFRRRDPLVIMSIPTQKMLFCHILILFIVIYVLSWLVTIAFFDAEAYHPEGRYSLPIQIFGLLVCLSYVRILFSATKGFESLKFLFVSFLFIYLIGMNLTSAVQWGVQRYNEGIKFDGKRWERSEMIREVKRIPPQTIIYTNDSGALYLLAKRMTFSLIAERNECTLEHNPIFDDLVRKIRKDLYNKNGLIVYFWEGSSDLDKLHDLKEEVPLKCLLKVSDGAIYVWDDKKIGELHDQ